MGTADVQHHGPWPGRSRDRDWLRVARRTNNPLLRRPTARERTVRRLAFAVLALATLAVVAASALVYRAGITAERSDAARRPVTVTVVRQVQPTASSNVYLSDVQLEVTYTVDGVTHDTTLSTLFGAAPGTQLDAWVDPRGELTSRPQNHVATLVQSGLAGLGGLVLLACLAIGVRVGLGAWTMRLRGREWDEEWRALDTTGRRGSQA